MIKNKTGKRFGVFYLLEDGKEKIKNNFIFLVSNLTGFTIAIALESPNYILKVLKLILKVLINNKNYKYRANILK